MDLAFDGRVALVTGGGSGIGAATARALADQGAAVVVADLDIAAARRVAEAIGDAAQAVAADVSNPDAAIAMVGAAMHHFGALHVAVNAAGISSGAPTPLGETTDQTWRRIMSVNLDGVFHSMRAELPAIVAGGGGAIVNVSSVMGVVGSAGSSAYVAAKHGVVGLTRTAALEYAERGVRVNVVGPGYIDTPMLSPHTRSAPEQVAARHPMNRLGGPDEVAATVCFLASASSSFTTGSFVPVDGGYTAR
jgi:NAD(P)-dependent dehydrogenase (short-subunit alcohol dehydrogenase family)